MTSEEVAVTSAVPASKPEVNLEEPGTEEVVASGIGAKSRSLPTSPEQHAGGPRLGMMTFVVLLLSALLLLIFLLVPLDAERYPDASKGMAVMLITALWWVTEIVPLSITSLLPMVLYPLLGVVKASTLAGKFFKGTSFLFIAGFFIGLAIERWGLHKRFVCMVVTRAGRRVEFLIAGFMLSTWLLSMWISNTATILCIMPMATAFLDSLPTGHERFQSGFLLAIGYAATIGGIATPVGTPTNGIFMDLFEVMWPQEDEFSFAHFCACALPLSILLLIAVYLMVCVAYVWRGSDRISVPQDVFREEQAKLGKVTFEQMVVALDLLILIVLWFTASPIGDFKGWKSSVAKELNSGAIGLFFTLPLFLIPCGRWLPHRLQTLIGEDRCNSVCEGPVPSYIMDWESVKKGFKWEILFVFGGGAMIAYGTVESGLADLIAGGLANIGTGVFGFILVITIVVCFVTEVVSNMATLSIFGSIIATTAHALGYNQVQLMMVVCFAASFAFMLPMAGGPNMVVYSTGRVSIRYMASFGFFLNILAIIIGSLYTTLVLPSILGDAYDTLPAPSAEA